MVDQADKFEGKYPTPTKAVRRHCIECVGSAKEVENCGGELIGNTGEPCPLYPYRFGSVRISVKTIRKECLACCGGSHKFVKTCISHNCNLYPFRMGNNPNYKNTAARDASLKDLRERKSKKEQYSGGSGSQLS